MTSEEGYEIQFILPNKAKRTPTIIVTEDDINNIPPENAALFILMNQLYNDLSRFLFNVPPIDDKEELLKRVNDMNSALTKFLLSKQSKWKFIHLNPSIH